MAEIRQTVILPLATTLDPNRLTVQIFLIDGSTGAATDWDSSDKAVHVVTSDGSKIANRVRVSITYSSTLLSPTPINLQSISEVPMAF